jgi:hypothetical protein
VHFAALASIHQITETSQIFPSRRCSETIDNVCPHYCGRHTCILQYSDVRTSENSITLATVSHFSDVDLRSILFYEHSENDWSLRKAQRFLVNYKADVPRSNLIETCVHDKSFVHLNQRPHPQSQGLSGYRRAGGGRHGAVFEVIIPFA